VALEKGCSARVGHGRTSVSPPSGATPAIRPRARARRRAARTRSGRPPRPAGPSR
jgi:hypothetical protein